MEVEPTNSSAELRAGRMGKRTVRKVRKCSAAGDCPKQTVQSADSSAKRNKASTESVPTDPSLVDQKRIQVELVPIQLQQPIDQDLIKQGVRIENFSTALRADSSGARTSAGRRGKLPRVSASTNGVITVRLNRDVEIDYSIEQNIRVRTRRFVVTVCANGKYTAVVHESAMLLHDGNSITGHFPPSGARRFDQRAVIGPRGVVFQTSNHPSVIHLDSRAEPRVKNLELGKVDWPPMFYDFASQIFFSKCPISIKRLESCKLWLKTMSISRMVCLNEVHYQISVGELTITQNGSGDLDLACGPQRILCHPRKGVVHVKNSCKVELNANAVLSSGFMKMEKKRIYMSCSGVMASDQNVVASVDNFGQFTSY